MLTWVLCVCRFLGMNLIELKRTAQDMMDQHGLTARGWVLDFNTNKSRAGVCYHRERKIAFSTVLMKHFGEAEALNTVTHEIAHALVGPGNGHNYTWKQMHIRLGGNGSRTWSDKTGTVIANTSKWRCECRVTRKVLGYRNRLTANMRNASCVCHREKALWIPNA